jgi:predicted metal-dependent hydrolase
MRPSALTHIALPCHDWPLSVAYNVVRSRRKTMVVHVRHQSVEVRAPYAVGAQQIQTFVSAHLPWIKRKLEQKAGQHREQADISNGGAIYFKGRQLNVRFVPTPFESVQLLADELQICGKDLSPEAARRVLQRWLMKQAADTLPGRTRALAKYFNVEHRLQEVVFRKTRTKWGHCTSSGRIQFNWLIMLAPDGVIDYMISHEVCHLLHMNHSRAFWQLLQSVCPDYRTYVTWLRKHEHRLWF